MSTHASASPVLVHNRSHPENNNNNPAERVMHSGAPRVYPDVFFLASVAAAFVAGTGPALAEVVVTTTGHDDAYLYRLPYDDGESYPVLQAYGSRFSHRGAEYYTVDFRMAEGTPVRSAREGVVTEADGTHRTRCWDTGCVTRRSPAN